LAGELVLRGAAQQAAGGALEVAGLRVTGELRRAAAGIPPDRGPEGRGAGTATHGRRERGEPLSEREDLHHRRTSCRSGLNLCPSYGPDPSAAPAGGSSCPSGRRRDTMRGATPASILRR